MPTTRVSSQTPTASSTPLRTSAIPHPKAPSSSRSTRSTRANSSTPQRDTSIDSAATHPHGHHITADEQTLLEAQKILSTPVGRRLDAALAGTPGSSMSARDRRHAKLNEAREHAEDHDDEEIETGSSSGSVTASAAQNGSVGSAIREREGEVVKVGVKGEDVTDTEDQDSIVASTTRSGSRKSITKGKRGGSVSHLDVSQDFDPKQNQASSTASTFDLVSETLGVTSDDDPSTVRPQSDEVEEVEDDSDGVSSGEQSSLSESEEESDSDEDDEESESNTSDEDSDEEEARLEQLLHAAKISALAKQPTATETDASDDKETGEVVLQFEGEEKKAAPIPDLQIPSLPKPHLSFAADGSAKASTSTLGLGPSKKSSKSVKGKEKAVAPEMEVDDRPYERELSKREKAAQPRKATASELWATLPSARADALPQMKRDYQALALANSLDPKRFMKGGNKANKVPERFAIGTMVEQSRKLKDTTLTREVQYRPGQIVQNMVRDQGLGGTAKRKYEDLQHKRMENGRGKGWKKRTKW